MSTSTKLSFSEASCLAQERDVHPPNPSIAASAERRDIAAAAGGDFSAYHRLVASHQDPIFQLCLRLLGCHADAAEASQDVFVKAFQALPRYRPEAKFSTWLHQIALNRCRDIWKQKSSRLASLCDSLHASDRTDIPCQGEQPDSKAGWNDEVALLERALHALPHRHREILILSCVESLSHTECASILQCSERAIEGRLYRARRALQRWWKNDSAENR